MAIFGTMFKTGGGRSTPMSRSHPYAESADPPTTPVIIEANRSSGALSQPSRGTTTTTTKPQACPTQKLEEGQAFSSSSTSSDPSTSLSLRTPVKTPTSTPRFQESATMSKSSPIKWSRSAKSTPTSALPPSLPPPTYGIPPTPGASPDRSRLPTPVLGRETLHVRKASLKAMSRPAPSAPPTSFAQTKHSRTASGPSPVQRTPDRRGRSASTSTPAVHTERSLGTSSPVKNHAHAQSVALTNPRPPLVQSVSAGHIEKKHRPAALKLRTSNLTPEPRGTGGYKPRRLPTIELNNAEDMGRTDDDQFEMPAPYSSGYPDLSAVDPDHQPHVRTPTPSRPLTTHNRENGMMATAKSRPVEQVERRRSMSTGDVLNIAQIDKLRDMDETPRKQRSVPALNQPPPSPSPQTHTPSSTMSDVDSRTPATGHPALPTATSATPGRSEDQPRPFENLPLPWATVPASTLEETIGRAGLASLTDFTLSQLVTLSPHLLPPVILKTSASEEGRLRSELSRLKEKYAALISHRDSLARRIEASIVKVDQGKLHKMVSALGQTSRRCDRVARQVYICNDQIRQIEIQGEEHVVGALRLALKDKEEEVERLKAELAAASQSTSRAQPDVGSEQGRSVTAPIGKQSGQVEADMETLRVEQKVDEKDDRDPTESCTPRHPPSPSPLGTVRFLDPVPTHPGSPLGEGGMRISFCPASRPMSTATILNINSLSFPIPPDRMSQDSESCSSFSSASASVQDQSDLVSEPARERGAAAETEAQLELELDLFGGLQVHVEPGFSVQDDDGEEIESADSHTTTISLSGHNEIVIYPPGHRRSLSAPSMGLGTGLISGMDQPHTPWRAEHYQPTLSAQNESHEDAASPLMIYARHERSASESDCSPCPSASLRITEPLRLRIPLDASPSPGGFGFGSPKDTKGLSRAGSPRRMAKSLTVRGVQDGVKRSRLGRESMLETPESILLSLATAPLWTKQNYP